ncbi:MAG: two component system sensor histidine kinase, related to CopS [Deltaproteobacteria bacterium]|nr:two component system sensor histidine kinase, related to CopS [Deltaproteobacteria bacterium]
MFLRKPIRLTGKLAFKLTLWYAVIFTVSCFGALIVFYVATVSIIRHRTDLELLKDAKEFSSAYTTKGLDELKAAMLTEMESEGAGNMFIRLADGKGENFTLPSGADWRASDLGRASINRLSAGENYYFETLAVPGRPYRFRVLTSSIAPDMIIQIGQSLEDDERLVEACREVLSVTLGLIAALAALGGFLFARHALAGVEEVTKAANEISKGAFSRRVDVKGRGEEIDTLAETFNRMVGKIEILIRGMKEMTDNIAHDLKSPITRIRGIAEATLTGNNPLKDFDLVSGSIVEECDRLLVMINTMLDISEAEAGVAKLTIEVVDVAQVVREACDLFQPVAENNQVRIDQRLTRNATIHGDKMKIQRAVSNLLDNALKYTPQGGTVTALVEGESDRVILTVNDTGPGISDHDLPHVFDRFFRGDRSRSLPGTGLGLNLTLAIARAHGGDVRVTSVLGQGSTFTMTLPRFPFSR